MTRVLIPQEAYIFSGTVMENLSYLLPDASVDEVEQAVDAVGAWSPGRPTRRTGRATTTRRPVSLVSGN